MTSPRDCNAQRVYAHAWRIVFILGLMCLMQPQSGHAAVWNAAGEWNDSAESRYSAWVARQFKATLFYEQSPYAPFATDCADAAYAMRLIYAYESRLPFVIADPERPGQLISQATTRFDYLPAGLPRMRAFMEWIANLTSTGTLAQDTYPIQINRQEMRPGIIFLAWRTHALQVVGVLPTGVLRYLESTSPRAIRVLTTIHGLPFHVPADPQSRRWGDGYRRFKWPQHYGQPESQLPGYGTEQFAKALAVQREPFAFQEWVRQRLAYLEERPTGRAHRHLMTLCQMAWERATTIDGAQQLLRARGRRCLSPSERPLYSTPGRDRAIRRAFDISLSLMERPDWSDVSPRFQGFYALMADHLDEADAAAVGQDFISWCDINRVDGGPGRPMHLGELQALSKANRLVADPHASPRQRWGLQTYTPTCPGSD